jgi:aspartate aminotransferase
MKLSQKAQRIDLSKTIEVDTKAKKMKAEGIDVIGFGAGEPDFETPMHIKNAAKKAIEDGFTRYTAASGILELKEAICQKFKEDNGLEYHAEDIVVSNGAKHSLTNAFMAILNPGDEVIIPAPFWVSYPQMVKMSDGVPVILETTERDRFKLTQEKLKSAITKKTKAIIVNSPSNPTGMIYAQKELEKIARVAVEEDLLIVSDEIYEELVYGDHKHISIASLGEEVKERTIVVNGLSKAYAMTGWRMGYSASPRNLAKAMANIQSHATSNPNSIAQKASVAALLGGKECVLEMKVEFEKRRDYMVGHLNLIDGLSCMMPDGAFYVMLNVSRLFGKAFGEKRISNSDDFSEVLLDQAHVAVVAGSSFGADSFVRLSYSNSLEVIKEGVRRIEKFVKNLK